MKTKLIYTNLPIDQIHYLDRPEFHKEEKEFNNLMFEDGYKNLFHFPNFKEFIKSVTSE